MIKLKSILSNLLKIGLEGSEDSLSYWRSLLINWLVFISISIGVVLIFINLYFATYYQAGLTLIGVVMMFVVFWLNNIKKQEIASIYFVFLCSVIVFISSIDALKEFRFNERENLLYLFLLVSVMLFDKRKLLMVFGIISMEIFYLKYHKSIVLGYDEFNLFAQQMVNVVVIIVGVYASSTLFKMVLLKALSFSTEQKKLLYTLIDNIPLFIGIYGTDGRYKMVNLSYVNAYTKSRDKIIGKRMREILHPASADVFEPFLERALQGEVVEFHEKTLMKSGSVIVVNGKYVPIFNEQKEVSSVTVAFHDITRLENIREELEKVNQSKDKLFSIVSHDIKSPLNNFQSLLSISRDQIINQKEFIAFVEKLQEQFSPILKTVDGLLVWSKMQLQEMKPVFEQVECAPLLDEILSETLTNSEAKEIKINVKGKQDLVSADQNHLKIILRNIIVNAIKFTPLKGLVNIELSQHDHMGVIKISDTGVGISNDKIESILNGGFLESTIGTSGEKGTGLGLKICTELITSNKGQFKIISSLNTGSSFNISIPLA